MKEQEIKKAVGKIIREYRKGLNLTQANLGKMIGINQRQVALIENGHSIPKLSTMLKMAELFNCSLENFFQFETPSDTDIELRTQIKSILKQCDKAQLQKIYSIMKIIRE